jgi:YVTN family beta-propeller protein
MKKKIDLLKSVFYGSLMLTMFAACEKEDPIPESKPVTPTSGVFILNQGSYQGNNSGVSYYDLKTGGAPVFDIVGGKLGDTGQDMIVYGSKLYVSVYGSSIIYVADKQSLGELKKIRVEDGDQPRGPRSLVSYSGKVYASTYDGNVIRIDTTSLSIEAITKVGSNPEGIAAVDGKLYVANSNGLDFPHFDNTLSVIDVATFVETKRITVGLNPNCVMADAYGDIYLSYRGNNADIPGGMQKVDTKTAVVSDLTGVSANQNFTIVDDVLYYFNVVYNADYTTNCTFGRYNVKTEQKIPGEIISDGTKINTAYAIGVDPESKDIYISDTNYTTPDKVYIFGSNGVFKKTIEVGISACKFVFI